MAARRPRGTGSLVVRDGSYFGKWRIGGRQVMRKLGPVRPPGTKLGLTKSQAEQELRRRLEREKLAAASERMTVETAGERYLDHLENVMQRASSTVHDYRIMLDRHLAPYFGRKALDRIGPDDVIAYMAFKRKHGRRDRKGQPVPGGFSPKTIQNHITFFHGLMRWSIKRGWAHTNPVDAVDRPRSQPTDPDIRFLSLDEVNAVIEAVPDDVLGSTDRVLYLTAAMTGLRQGELIALRWSDIDWDAAKVRVRRKWHRGEMGKPKSKRASRGVPLAAPLAEALRLHREESAYSSEGELVLPHPQPATRTTPRR